LNEIPKLVSIEGTKIILSGSDETEEGTYNAILKVYAGAHDNKIEFPF
jgi:hypothetical protein